MTNPSPQQEKTRVRVLISGIVQGVGYRFSTLQQAKTLAINGWVRNVRNGRVEAVFEGTQAQVEAMIRWCYQGSRSAIVTNVDVEYEHPEGIEGFEIRR